MSSKSFYLHNKCLPRQQHCWRLLPFSFDPCVFAKVSQPISVFINNNRLIRIISIVPSLEFIPCSRRYFVCTGSDRRGRGSKCCRYHQKSHYCTHQDRCAQTAVLPHTLTHNMLPPCSISCYKKCDFILLWWIRISKIQITKQKKHLSDPVLGKSGALYFNFAALLISADFREQNDVFSEGVEHLIFAECLFFTSCRSGRPRSRPICIRRLRSHPIRIRSHSPLRSSFRR